MIPAWNESQYIERTLIAVKHAQSTQRQKGCTVVVNNNSSDDTEKIARDAGATVVFEPINQIARARNTGAKESRGRWLVFVDADTVISPQLLGATLTALESGTVTGGGATVAFDQRLTGMASILVRVWNWWSVRSRTAAGCYLFCTREAFEQVGGFDEKQYVAEELYLSKALRQLAKKRGERFIIISDSPVLSSARKRNWYSTTDFIRQLLRLLIPGASRSKERCGMWYHRDGANGDGDITKSSDRSDGH